MTIQFGIDQVKDKMDMIQQESIDYVPPADPTPPPAGSSPTGDGCPV